MTLLRTTRYDLRYQHKTSTDMKMYRICRILPPVRYERRDGITLLTELAAPSPALAAVSRWEHSQVHYTGIIPEKQSTEDIIKAICQRLRELVAERESLVRRLKRLFADQNKAVKDEAEMIRKRLDATREERERVTRDFLEKAASPQSGSLPTDREESKLR